MIFTELSLAGAWRIHPEPSNDSRGSFARTFCAEEFAAHGLDQAVLQCGESFNHRKGTVRGLHWQAAAAGEVKLVRCTTGRVFDVMVDLRANSPTFGQWCATELSPRNRAMHYIPVGFAHGFQTLEDGSTVVYQMSAPHSPEFSRGVRWDDPAIGIEWPLSENLTLSDRDGSLPLLADLKP